MNYHLIQLLLLPRALNFDSDPTQLALATPLAQLMTPLRAIYHTHTYQTNWAFADHVLEKPVPMQQDVDARRRSLVPSVSFGDPTRSSSLWHINTMLHWEGDLYIATDVMKLRPLSTKGTARSDQNFNTQKQSCKRRIKRTLFVTWLTGLTKWSHSKPGLTGPFELMNPNYRANTI